VTAKQKRFVEEYLLDLNATQAAIRAGYSPDTAREIGCENLTKPDISRAIAKAMAERSRRTGINQDRVVRELAKIAFVNASDVIDLKRATVLEEADREDLACIQSVKVKDGNTMEREVRLADKLRALELLGKHLGMWTEKVQVSGLEEERSKLAAMMHQLEMTDEQSDADSLAQV
jgi:phage terminase small subunit